LFAVQYNLYRRRRKLEMKYRKNWNCQT
jgi:hypothetical protein